MIGENMHLGGNNFCQLCFKFSIYSLSFFNKTFFLAALSATVNAFNYLDDNSIEFPAAILQKQFYNSRRPNYLNFGAIGMVSIMRWATN